MRPLPKAPQYITGHQRDGSPPHSGKIDAPDPARSVAAPEIAARCGRAADTELAREALNKWETSANLRPQPFGNSFDKLRTNGWGLDPPT